MSIHTLEPAYHPNQKMSFLIDWLITLKCNYDCGYCPIGPDGHDNSTKHPPMEKCLKMLEQMYQYTDAIMVHKKNAFKDAILNIYGGESLYHPDILEIMAKSSRMYEKYSDRWRLKRRLTTNGTATEKNWKVICDHVEGVTMSYHSPGPAKMKKLFKNNTEYLHDTKKEYDVVVLMYPHTDFWKDCVDFMHWATDNSINARAKMLDGPFMYDQNHLDDLAEFIPEEELKDWAHTTKPDNQSRGCCGGRKMCFDRNLKQHKTLVPRGINGFEGWHCRVKLDGGTGAIADMNTMSDYIDSMRKTNKLPTLVCAQKECLCGTCAPKAVDSNNLNNILKIYNTL